MSAGDLILLLPIITLTTAILILLLLIAFYRHLALSCGFAALGLLATLGIIIILAVQDHVGQVTALLSIDRYGLLFAALISLASLLICIMSYGYQLRRGENQDEFYVLLLLSTLGAIILTHSIHFASLILGLELLGIAIYSLISYPNKGLLSLEAALKYIILSGVSSAFILFGTALLYAVLGSLSFSEMQPDQLPPGSQDRLFILLGTAMLLAGMGFKLSLVPFHMWTPDVYGGAPAPVAGFLAAVSKSAIFAVLLRLFISMNTYQLETVMTLLFWFALLSMLVGNLLALLQNQVKRLLAYSSIAQLGYLMVAFIAAGSIGGTQFAIEAVAFFLVAYVLTTVGAFGVVTVLNAGSEWEDDRLEYYAGLFWRRPWLALFFTIMMLSLAGIPLTAGFIGKFYLLGTAIESALWPLIVVLVIGSGIGLYYYLRIILIMTEKNKPAPSQASIPKTGSWAIAGVTLLILFLGIYPTPLISWITEMAKAVT